MKIIDAHSHIDYITHKHQSDVVGTVCCATAENQWVELINLINADKNIFGAFGIHPWFIENVSDDFDLRLEKLLQTDSGYMIGEIGLDKYKPDMDKQLYVFVKQFDVAVKLKRTVFLHCVGAWDKILHVLKQYKTSELPIIVAHAFSGSDDIVNKLLQYDNIFFSFNKIDTNGRNSRIEHISDDKILVETDGKSNIILTDLINQIARIKNKSNMGEIIFDNTQRLLKK